MHGLVEPNSWIFLRLTSSSLKIVQAVPNTTITLPKYGSFSTNLLLSRPYFLTYELLDRLPNHKNSLLRVVPTSELHADSIAEEDANANSDIFLNQKNEEYNAIGPTSEPVMRSNRNIIDSASRQTLTMAEIEALKKEGTDAGKDLIEKLLASHVGIDEKTSFSLAKYKLLKVKKYLKRFTVLPVDVPLLTQWLMKEKDTSKILEIREEMLALVGSWANVHFSSTASLSSDHGAETAKHSGRWLVVDETGGLLTASIAERMGLLYPEYHSASSFSLGNFNNEADTDTNGTFAMASTNTITLVHNNTQPNLSLLKYFSFTPDFQSSSMDTNRVRHPLATNLFLINWLQLLAPHQDTTYATPFPYLGPAELSAMKSSRRATYHRKFRRWKRAQHVVTNTLSGGFDGLAVVSQMDPVSVLRPLLPLLRGGAQISIYSPYVEPLVMLADLFSTSRRTAFIQGLPLESEGLPSIPKSKNISSTPLSEISSSLLSPGRDILTKDSGVVDFSNCQGKDSMCSVDFPLNPTLLLNSTIQSARIRDWQVLPGRTHPLMTGKGGAEGYLFTAVRVLPAEGRVEARGKFSRKRVAVDEQNKIIGKKLRSDEEALSKIS
ncbi:tRNA -methyltransferase non-catalytic subunit trm6 [Golovinomyces cichoracearum]|uniref:tRNA (adenine(58)-N(1))-methyltransferase non-catalytic subunit TRM6 n=1 Tax=Golovinomyces cichoracearum TaxID=62708 RepID=A0A420J1G8_9PEZI|nr:tRNA -methyltransferase non-catalytic subunit trm6 [Golovinomyces cichoracearum]